MLLGFQHLPFVTPGKSRDKFRWNVYFGFHQLHRSVLNDYSCHSSRFRLPRKHWCYCLSEEPTEENASQKCSSNIDIHSLESSTKVVKAGHKPEEWTTDPLGRSFVNPPVYHASTITFPTVEAYREAAKDYPFTGLWYGRHGTPTAWALEEAFAVIEGGYKACAVASGVAAINAALLAFLKSGDHILMTDAVYDPTRSFCEEFLKRFGVQVTYYDPVIPGEELRKYLQHNTKIVFVESPASLSFEIQNIPMLAKVAHQHGAIVMMDNTWVCIIGTVFMYILDSLTNGL